MRARLTVPAIAIAAAAILAAAPVIVTTSAAAAVPPSYLLNYTKLPNGQRVLLRWNPCRTHTYKVNLAAAPAKTRPALLAETHAALRIITAKTGISFKYLGQTGEVPRQGSSAKQTAEIIIAFTTPAKTNHQLSGATLGQGGYAGQTTGKAVSATAPYIYTTGMNRGFVVIDTPDALRRTKPGFGAGLTRGNLLLHELGHVIGLGHVNNRGLLMNNSLSASSPRGFAGGDLAGLARIGRKAGCINGM